MLVLLFQHQPTARPEVLSLCKEALVGGQPQETLPFVAVLAQLVRRCQSCHAGLLCSHIRVRTAAGGIVHKPPAGRCHTLRYKPAQSRQLRCQPNCTCGRLHSSAAELSCCQWAADAAQLISAACTRCHTDRHWSLLSNSAQRPGTLCPVGLAPSDASGTPAGLPGHQHPSPGPNAAGHITPVPASACSVL